jgi:glutathione S-transferase
MLPRPVADSLDITFYLAEHYPSLMPSDHETDIKRLLRELHSINFFSLSFTGKPHLAEGFKLAVSKRLNQVGISQRYADALRYELEV